MIWALHGFLGRGADWDDLGRALARAGAPALLAPDLFTRPPHTRSLAEWGAEFAAEVAAKDTAPILLGYSLGGRLALHALLAAPERWRRAVIVSAHPGLTDPRERAERRRDDERWAVRFEREPWDRLLQAWDARAVFGGTPTTRARPEAAFDRTALAAALRVWSLGAQDDLRPALERLTIPVLWIAGARDARYVTLAEEACDRLPRGTVAIAPDTGHRVPWERPGWFAERVTTFLQDVDERGER